jgi:biopolymer transport protein ExbD
MQITRTQSPKTMISLVPMVDVMLILLVFFMVTSTYLNLDMIPVVDTAEQPAAATATDDAATLLIHLAADGRARVRGQPHGADSLAALIRTQLSVNPLTSFVVLPSGGATTQNLVTVMDTATRAGATRLRLIRLSGNSGSDQ